MGYSSNFRSRSSRRIGGSRRVSPAPKMPRARTTSGVRRRINMASSIARHFIPFGPAAHKAWRARHMVGSGRVRRYR